ncbi:MAG: OmpA-OmpF porin, family [Hydrocarboniphaga sp.]|uniref:OmpA family protein n=1 Tax=Hydrocarboniphaga sp. TaxID=2033016 RepID=UPI00262D4C2A|nr:OmpA family protein [Hydrocarboniphaga sp.]MDB5969440.1 OmpA-OmpF porin, family [Hydrocarboniphaga sp.]
MKFARRKAAAAIAAVIVSLASHHADAQDEASSGNDAEKPTLSYVGILGSYLDLDKARLPSDGWGVGAYYGRQLGHGNWFWEAQAFAQNLETDEANMTDFYRTGGGLDLVYSLNQRRTFSPFLLLGVGGNYNDVVPDKDDKFGVYGNAGIGVVTRPYGTYGFRLRAEARYIYDDFDGGQNDFRYSVGIELPLSPYEQPHVVPPPPVEPTEVVKTETMADSDGDGVPDQFDKCPGTPTGMPVDGVGCGLEQVITLTGVNFEFDKASLTPDSRKILEDVALKVAHFKDVPMTLEGHTDSKGSDAYNMKLSQLRADSVRNFLIEQGVSGDKLTAKGMGEGHPVADNNTDAGRALNRRVELHIAGQTAPPSVPVDASGAALPGADSGMAAPSEPAPPPAAEETPAPAPAEETPPPAEEAPPSTDEPAPAQ